VIIFNELSNLSLQKTDSKGFIGKKSDYKGVMSAANGESPGFWPGLLFLSLIPVSGWVELMRKCV
jgi:hypothetical protein